MKQNATISNCPITYLKTHFCKKLQNFGMRVVLLMVQKFPFPTTWDVSNLANHEINYQPSTFGPNSRPPLSIGFAIVLSLELDDPNALARRTTVLLDDTWLEGHGFLEACGKLLWRVVGQGVLQANVHRCHLRQQTMR